MQEPSKAAVEDAFREMGEILAHAGKLVEIAVYGGAAVMLQFAVTFRTADVDAQVRSGDDGALMQAANLLAMKLRAMRIGRRDEADAALLARASYITTADALLALLQKYFPKEPPDARRIAIIGQFARTLNASDNAG